MNSGAEYWGLPLTPNRVFCTESEITPSTQSSLCTMMVWCLRSRPREILAGSAKTRFASFGILNPL